MDTQTIVDLKLRALELKKSGDVEGAKALLAKARDLELESAEDLDHSAALKRLAVALKKRGDLDGARAALAKAKRLEASVVVAPPEQNEHVSATSRVETPQAAHHSTLESGVTQHDIVVDGPHASTTTEGGEDGRNMSAASEEGPITFTDEEMMDHDMMSEFKQSGMDVPSSKDYEAKVLASKRVAVKFKQQGDIEKAKEALKRAKRLEAVMTMLNKSDESDDELNEEDEAWLMKELNQEDSVMFDESVLFGDDEGFSLDDLDEIDAEMLKVMMDAGIDVPTPEEVLDLSKEKKALAVGLKQNGNLVGAKAALVESKRLKSRADRLKDLLGEIAKGSVNDEVDLDDLEKLLLPPKDAEPTLQPKEPAAPVKSANELKQEVLKLRSEGRIKEATDLFKIYKQVLAQEAEAAELLEREKLISTLHREIKVAEEQDRLFLFYERFIDSEDGAMQSAQWREYARKCDEAIKTVDTKGSDSVDISRSGFAANMLKIDNDDLEFVGSQSDPSDERLEVAIFSLLDVQENRIYKKMQKEVKKASGSQDVQLSIRIDVTIQLPPNEHDTEENITLSFSPLQSAFTNKSMLKFDFGPSEFVSLPRGRSTYAKMIQRRLGRKRVQILVYHVPVPVKKPGSGGSWLKSWSSKPSTEEKNEPVLLGRVVLELREFLTGNAIAGDYALADSGRKELGGLLRLGLQVGAPYDDAAAESAGFSRTAVCTKPFSPIRLTAGVC